MKLGRATSVLTIFICLCSCTTAKLSPTLGEDFAVFDKLPYFRAASADGVFVQTKELSREDIGANQDLGLWRQEIGRVLDGQGYSLLSEQMIAPEVNYREYQIFYNSADYVYGWALVKKGSRMFRLETGGEREALARYREKILGALKELI